MNILKEFAERSSFYIFIKFFSMKLSFALNKLYFELMQ